MAKSLINKYRVFGICFFAFIGMLASSFGIKELSSVKALSAAVPKIEGDTAYQLLAPSDEDIAVVSEHLQFDFGDTEHNDYDYSPGLRSKMTATYDISNSGPTKTVQMGFPFVTSFADLGLQDIKVMHGDEEISHQAYYGKQYSDYFGDDASTYLRPSDIDNLTLEQALDQTITEDRYIDATLTSTVYSFQLDDIASEMGVVKFEADPSKTTLILDSGVSYMNNDYGKSGNNSITLYANILPSIPDDALSFSVIGEDIEELRAYGADAGLSNLVSYDAASVVTRATMNFKNKVAAISATNLIEFETHYRYDSVTGEETSAVFPLDAATALSLLEYETVHALSGTFCLRFDDLMGAAWASYRVIVIVFDAELMSGSENNYSIAYPYATGIDSTYDPEIYALNYVSNPGKKWSSFGPLTVTVIPPSDTFVVNASITFLKEENGAFVSTLMELPEHNISFSICASESPSNPWQDFFDFLKRAWNVFLFIACYIIPPMIVIAVFIFTILFKKKAKKRQMEAIKNGDIQR